ncbi:CHAT domain-containing tetratricopeptide repeat protein [Flavobacterium sp.]|uniref:CHAT domain-containing protein n=1 Tax=Flavobacterium sp. TaxID=239 RepID=UPI00286D9CB7|nr:CHAT domain-containing tetratricopeptide repeat protein [Flavobacterium sp.]
MKNIFNILFFICLNCFGQNSNVLENKIYESIDQLVTNPSKENLQISTNSEKIFSKSAISKPELLALTILECNKAFYENQFGKTNYAISSYEKAWQIFQKNKLKNYDIIEYCLKPLGNLYTIIGDYDNAENTIKQYYFIANNSNNQEHKIASILNLSNVYQSSGRIENAIDLLNNTINNEVLSTLQKGVLLNNLGSNYMLNNNFELAKSTLELSVSELKKQKNQSQLLSNSYRNLATIYAKGNDLVKAKKYFNEAKKIFFTSKNEPRKIAKLHYEEALLYFQEKNLKATTIAITSVFKVLVPNFNANKNILPEQKTIYAETVLTDALDLQAAVFYEQKNYKKTVEAYKLSFYIDDLFQSLLVYENSKIINQVSSRNRTEKCLSVLVFLYKKEKNSNYITDAFLLSEKSKASVLQSYISKSKNTSQKEKALIEKVHIHYSEIIKEQQKGNLADISKINKIIEEQNNLMLHLKSMRPLISNNKKQDIDLESLFKKLKNDNATMVSYFSGFENLYAFTIQNSKIMMEKFIVMDNKINVFLNYFSTSEKITNDISGYAKTSFELYSNLKLSRIKNQKNLIVIPDGKLNFIPFEALITKKSTTTNFAKMHYLLNDFTIAYNNSVSFYLNGGIHKKTKNTVLGMFPVFENTDSALTFSKDELNAIKKNFEGNYFENDKATFSNFKQNASQYSILHLSTHASSGDIYDSASIKFFDQDILYSELYNININPNLVVLSACETGLGKLFKGEGAMSVARGFQFAGAQNLLFSLWKVNDFTTSKLMENFYNNIHKNEPYFESIANAKHQFLNDKTISNVKKSPYYWAPFVYYGSLENNNESKLRLWALGLLSLVGIAFLFWKKYKKSKTP